MKHEYMILTGGENITLSELNLQGQSGRKVCGIINGSILFVREVVESDISVISEDIKNATIFPSEDQPDLSFLDVGISE